MKSYRSAIVLICLALGLAAAVFAGCEAVKPVPEAKLQVIPDKTVISPELLKAPVKFAGSGFAPKEMVIVEMIVPPGVEIKGVAKGEDVGLAYGNADERGEFQAAMAATATLNWFFQTGWSPTLAPDLKQAKPIPPGRYEIKATGADSGAVGKAILEILPPPPPSEKK
jgi:hypothetical protein